MKKAIYRNSLLVIACLLILIIISSEIPSKSRKIPRSSGQGFVIMELFTSQGCSSCPPADEILAMYARKNDEHIIPLAFHVDYWNRLGWIDSFSKNMYSQRQREYAEKLKIESVYTPQLIINGETEMVGNNGHEIAEKITSYLNEKIGGKIDISNISVNEKKVKVDYSIGSLSSDLIINAALVQKNAVTNIRAGENRGVRLENCNVVRDFKTQKFTTSSGNFTLELPAENSIGNYMVVLFVQNAITGSIKSAVQKNFK